MIPLPKDFDAAAARALLADAWSQAPQPRRDAAFEEASAPVYEKFLSVGPGLRPAKEAFAPSDFPGALGSGDPAALDVATDVLGRALPPERLLELGRALLACKPWPRLRNLVYEAVARLPSEAAFRFLLDDRSASSFLLKSAFREGEPLVLERLLASPMMKLTAAFPTRSEAASWPEDKRSALEAERKAKNAQLDPAENKVFLDLISYVVERGSKRGREVARAFVEGQEAVVGGARARAAVALLAAGDREDLECLSHRLDDPDTIVRQNAIRAVLSLDIGAAWERLEGDRLLKPGSEAEADELLLVLARDASGTGGAPVRGWAKQEPRFIELARHWLPNKKMQQPEFLLTALGEKT